MWLPINEALITLEIYLAKYNNIRGGVINEIAVALYKKKV